MGRLGVDPLRHESEHDEYHSRNWAQVEQLGKAFFVARVIYDETTCRAIRVRSVKLGPAALRDNWRGTLDLERRFRAVESRPEYLRNFARTQRRRPTPGEGILWQKLRRKQLGVKFRRQAPLYGYIPDFYCPAARLIVEVDGPAHSGRPLKDAMRQALFEGAGLSVLRIRNEDVVADPDAVVRRIAAVVASRAMPFPRAQRT